VAEVAHDRGSFIERIRDLRARPLRPEPSEENVPRIAGRKSSSRQILGIRLEIPCFVGVVRDENDRPLRERARGLVLQDLRHHRPGLLGARRRKPSDGEVGKIVVAVNRGIARIGSGPEIRRSHHGGWDLVLHSRAQVVFEVVRGIAQKKDVPRCGRLPVMVGVRQELPDCLRARLAESKLGVDVFDRDFPASQSLTPPQIEKGPR
jgi:hypothetical protein